MKNLIKKCLLIAIVTAIPLIAKANNTIKVPDGGRLKEVQVLSLQFTGNGSATMVARPCDEYIQCKKIFARISEKTVWRNSQHVISYNQAKRLDWKNAVLVVDKHNNAIAVSRMPGIEEL